MNKSRMSMRLKRNTEKESVPTNMMLSNTVVTGFRSNKDLNNKIDLVLDKNNKKHFKLVYIAGNNIVFMDNITKE
jgi:hypothetical protein